MELNNTVTLKDGRACILRNGTASDGQALLDVFNLTHEQTDFLLTYPEEHRYTAQQEQDRQVYDTLLHKSGKGRIERLISTV
jgi:hypothetical protein